MSPGSSRDARIQAPTPKYFETAKPIGPLATFSAAHTWVDHPYRDGVALLGDSAVSSDPTWGQGLSLTCVTRECCGTTCSVPRIGMQRAMPTPKNTMSTPIVC